ncbi:hypothetical protein ACA106_20950 [Agrobacterium pusense]|uniref:hypothetical protein n=1 Tax=Agrobacterium pusense TaxID=648995 RepID=UPI0035A5F79C
MSEKVKVFYPRFTCRTVRNGGWLIEHEGSRGEMNDVVAAFTNTRDFLAYMATHIEEEGLERVGRPEPWEKNGGAA